MDRVVPHNAELEQKLLGQIFLDNKIFPMVMNKLSMKDFYVHNNSLIYEAMERVFSEDNEIDSISVSEALGNNLQTVTMTYVVGLAGSEPTSHGYEVNVQKLKELSNKRQTMRMCEYTIKNLHNPEVSNGEMVSKLTHGLLTQEDGKSKVTDMATMLCDSLSLIEGLYKGEISLGMESKIGDLDKALNNFQKKELVVIGARPSMGKTTLAMNIIKGLSENNKGLFFSMEQAKEQLMFKMLAAETWINGIDISTGNLKENDFEAITRASNNLMSLNLKVDDRAGLGIKDIQSTIIQEKQAHGLDFVVIDYLQYMNYAEYKNDSNKAVTYIMQDLKRFSKEYDLNVIVLSQLSRALELRADKRPIMSDLRESGAIEQEADKILFLYRDEYYNKESEEKNILEVNIAKNRNGKVGTVKLAYISQYQKIGSLDTSHSLEMKI
ncbi:MAG: replicative DNA helicase [Bacillota bacterium]|nr:replicative DNA helicase [Bacillota bacterium]